MCLLGLPHLFTYVTNNVEANILACTAGDVNGKVFNIACGERYTILDLVDTINKLLGKSIKPKFATRRPGDVLHSLADIKRAKMYLGFEVKVNFETGLKKLIEKLCTLQITIEKIMKEHNIKELVRITDRKSELLITLKTISEEINLVLKNNEKITENSFEELKLQEIKWSTYQTKERELTQQMDNILKNMRKESQKLNLQSKIKSAYDLDPKKRY